MPPKRNNAQGEPATEEPGDARVELVVGEVTKLKAVVEELVAQSLQNQNQMETLRKEAAENQMKLLNLMLTFSKEFEEKGEGQGSVTKGKSSPGTVKSSGNRSLRQLEGDDLEEFRQSMKKIELPSFYGEDPAGWIARAEIYFNVQETREAVRVSLAQLCMEGGTIHFFQSLLNEYENLSWEDLKRELLERYGGRGEGSVYDQLTSLKQTGVMEDYIRNFECLIAQVPSMQDEQYFSYFTHGLKDELRARMRSIHVANPLSRGRMMNVARAIDVEIYGRSRGWQGRGETRGEGKTQLGTRPVSHVLGKTGPWQNNGSWGGKGSSTSAQNDGGENSKNGPKDRGARHLSYQEMLERKKKGLCFKCGGSFGPLHQCPVKQLGVIMIDEEIRVECEENEEKIIEDTADDVNDVEGACTALSLYSMTKGKEEQPRTMKLRGKVGEIPMMFLVDSGATHNFISRKLVEALGWEWERTQHMKILMGDGHKSETQGVCRGMRVTFDEGEFVLDAFLFDLEDMDMVLGMSWLTTLGETTVDWKRQIMRVKTDQGERVLKGAPREDSLLVSMFGLLEEKREIKKDGLSQEQRCVLNDVLQNFAEVFDEPKGLPPVRAKEHSINLQPGQGPINVRLYRYAYHQKNEIEKQVRELMEVGHVRHSQSAYSSPVILVKKKNNKWRMCVDYRALNKATIPDKFPIPVIEELLDELHGAKFFSKLDLRSGYHQVQMRKEDIPKTAFRTHEGHYEYLVMPFGLMNAPSTFQALMNEVFRNWLRKGVLVFFDDILIYSKGWEEHLQLLEKVLSTLRANKLFANKEKCTFGQESIEYLGHIISIQGVAVDPNKVSSVIDWPIPTNVKEVHGFLGLTGYYRKFIKDYGKVARSLTELTKKDGFKWNEKAQEAFEELKRRITTAPVLQLPNFNDEFFFGV